MLFIKKYFFINAIIFIYILSYFGAICWNVNCDDNGECTITLDSTNQTIEIMPFYLPLIPEKNVVPLKNDSNSVINFIFTNITTVYDGKPRYGYVLNSKFECADGLDECMGGCCNMGFCSDPSNFCVRNLSSLKLIFLIVGLVFIVLVIAYWIILYMLGVKNNSKPLASKEEGIYVRFTPKIGTIVEMQLEGVPEIKKEIDKDTSPEINIDDDNLPPLYVLEDFNQKNQSKSQRNIEISPSPSRENLIVANLKSSSVLKTEEIQTPDFRTKASKGQDRRKIKKINMENVNNFDRSEDQFEEKKLNV